VPIVAHAADPTSAALWPMLTAANPFYTRYESSPRVPSRS
jgi:hypothetical protein